MVHHSLISAFTAALDCTATDVSSQFLTFRASDQKVIVSGVVTKGNADFKADAVKVAHEKPLPQHDKRPQGPGGKAPGMVIQQPRKQ